jgi:hypothetical protein
MKHFSLVPYISTLGKEFGKAGPPANANSSCGQWHIRGVGQLTDSQGRDFVTCPLAHYVTKLMKQLITCWSLLFLVDKFGLLF